ncbi:penicillin-binding transpeptidase domain-containing protein [Ligilactobacillus faecis]|uniref:Penicillin-binding transpeptidase domain-containing protein n=1 Tax=Ligilactobacillus faecis TaxID=762833 RepID=A0ABV4DNE1_9LACO
MSNKKRQINVKQDTRNRKYFGRALFFMVVIVFITFIGRFFYVGLTHTAHGKDLKKLAQAMYAERTEIKAHRGTIYDAQNEPIAEDTTTYSIYVVLSKTAKTLDGKPDYLRDSQKAKAARVLSQNLGMNYDSLKQLFDSSGDLYQVELGSKGKNISMETKKKIEAENISGIKFTSAQARLYPNGIFASHLIGLAENEQSSLVGVMGLEKVFNSQLKGVNGVSAQAIDSRGTTLPNSKTKSKEAKDGDNVYTTLDTRTQTYLETLMSKAQETYKPKSMTAVLMNAKTGEIIAASQRPTFNPQTGDGLNEMWRNILLEDAYEPGSIMKILTTAAAINSGNYNGNATFKSGSYSIDGNAINDWKPTGWGEISYHDGFIRSSNVGMAKLEQAMGSKTWMNYIKRFGLLKSTNAGLGNEASGSIEYKYPIEQANTAFGQGINVTVFQMLQAISAVANNGKMVKPYLVSKVVDPNTGKTVYSQSPKVVGRPIRSETAKEVRELMEDVVTDKDGTGTAYKIEGHDVGVKTGTAQIANANGTGYLTGSTNYLFSVAGMAPIDDPKYILYITMKQPKTFADHSETQMLASIFDPLMKRVLDESNSNNDEKSQATVPDVTGMSKKDATAELNSNDLTATVIGNGKKIVKQSLTSGSEVLAGQRVILVTNGTLTMPDITGWARLDVLKLSELTGVELDVQGSGYVKEQSIAPGDKITKGAKLTVKLE